MTRTNWILVLVISGLLAVGALGLGKLPALMGMGGRKMLWQPAPVAALATGVIRMAGTTDGTALQSEKSGLEERVAKARATAQSQVDAVVAIPVAKAAGVTGEDVAPLVNGWSEAEATKAFTVVRDKVAKHLAAERENLKVDAGSGAGADPFKDFDPLAHILPGPGDAFFVGESAEKGTRFVWVGDGKQGFWMGTREMEQQPPTPLKFVAAGVDFKRDLRCRDPNVNEWKEALKAANTAGIANMDGEYGEWVKDGEAMKVIGKATIPDKLNPKVETDWNIPLSETDRKRRMGIDKECPIARTPPEAEVNKLAKERRDKKLLSMGPGATLSMTPFQNEVRQEMQAELDREREDWGRSKDNRIEEDTFRHRWVIDPPIASLKTAPQ